MEAYANLASVYDEFMDNVPYEEWAEYFGQYEVLFDDGYYKFFDDKGVQVFPCHKTDCLVIKKFNGEIVAMLEQNVYHLEEFENHRKDSLFEPEIKKERKVYRPGLNHPYKKKFFDQYVKYYRKELQNNYAYVS